MTRDSHPVLFWLEVGALGLASLRLVIYGVASLLGLHRFTGSLDAAAARVPVLKLRLWALFGALGALFFALAWLNYSEMSRI